VVEHLKKHVDVSRTLGLRGVPDRTTVGRWWRRYLSLLEETFRKIAGMLQLVTPTTFLIADSTPLVDLYDMEVGWGYTTRGKFRGFKLHVVVNQLGLPLKATVTPRNRYGLPLLPGLLEDLEADFVLADAGYDSRRNTAAAKAIGAEPVIASNSRRGKRKRIRHGELLKSKRYLVEQFSGHVKDNVLKECWIRPRGLVKKAAMVMTGLISYDAEALRSLILGGQSLKNVSK
jgi:transposase